MYDSMQNRPDEECISLVAKYVQCPDSLIPIKVMNVQLQDNAYAYGEFAVAFATSLIHGGRSCTPALKELLLFIRFQAPDNGKPMVRCCVCRQRFHSECIGVSTIGTHTDMWKCPNCTEAP